MMNLMIDMSTIQLTHEERIKIMTMTEQLMSAHNACLGGGGCDDKNILYALDRQFEIRLNEYLNWKKSTIACPNFDNSPEWVK